MPIYTYRCFLCGYEFDLINSVDRRNIPTSEGCPKCGRVSVVRQMSPFSFKIHGYSEANGYSCSAGCSKDT